MFDVLVIGAGFAGSTAARRLAEGGKKVLIVEQRAHVGGNAYDEPDENGVLRHVYGPHIFHTDSTKAVEFLSRFTEWFPYEHKVLGYIEGKLVPIPFNLHSIEACFEPEKAAHLRKVLVDTYGMGTKVPILKLRESDDPAIKELAEFIFEHVFKYYTMKQWGYTVDQLDPAVTGRVPVSVSEDDRYFGNSFQQMPAEGFTQIFRKMLDHPNIEVQCGENAVPRLKPLPEEGKILWDGEEFTGPVIYTGILDELFGYCLGELPYRSLWFDVQSHAGDYQPVTTVNYPTPAEQHGYTRISEYKKLMKNPPADRTTIAVEYPFAYDRSAEKGNIPYYPVFTEESQEKYRGYKELADQIPNLYPLGRLAEYRYYDMDKITEHALEFAEKLLK